MALTFMNRSRSFDASRNRVRFLGHDGMFEVPFSVEANALGVNETDDAAAEADSLAAFDAFRSRIHDVARKVYSHSRRPAYVITKGDFG